MNKLQFRVLYRDFLLRLIDLEILSSHAQGDATTLLGQFATLLILVSVFVYTVAAMGYASARMPPQGLLLFGWIGEHSLISTTMLVVALFAVLSWDSTFPSRSDVLVLAPLPVRAPTIFLAKVAAVATGLSITVLAPHVAAGIAWPLALNRSIPALSTMSYTNGPAMPPVEAADLKSVLDRDLANANVFKTGYLAPGTDAGVAIGVYKHGVRRVFAYGTARPDSLFEIGSITKTFTGLILAQMVQQGKVKYDEPVRALLPEGTVSKPAGAEITLLDLATQHSGLPRMPNNFHPADKTDPYADYHSAELYAYMARRGVGKPAKTYFNYSNLGFGLLGQALANRAGKDYPSLLQEEVTAPLKMNDTTIVLSPEQQRRFIQGHDGEHHPVHAWDLDALAGAGAIRSTAGDMLAYLEAQLHPGTGALAEALRESHKLRANVAPGAQIALAWFYNVPFPGTYCYWHNGATAGYTADAFFNPRDDFAAVVLSNTGPDGVGFTDWLNEHIRARLAGEPACSLGAVSVPATGGLLRLIRLFAAYWITMFAAGAFIFCCVLGIQGLAAQLLPRRVFLRVSSFLQTAVFCLFVSVYLIQPPAGPLSLISAQGGGALAWSPSYWFLGLFQQLIGSPALSPLANRAWIGMGLAASGTTLAYLLSYFRTLRKIVEEPDIVPGIRGASWLPRFGNGFETAIVHFSVRTLLRSRQHRLILAFYLGLASAAGIFFMRAQSAERNSTEEISAAFQVTQISDVWTQVNVAMLLSSILLLGFWIMGMRAVFSLPLDLRANWIFRVTPVPGGAPCLAARRRALMMLAVAPCLTGSAVLFLSIWPWRSAAGHLVVLGLIGITLVEVSLGGRQKIPFTCSWLPGKSNVHITFWLCLGLVVIIVTKVAEYEFHALDDRASYGTMLAILILIALAARLRTKLLVKSDEDPVQFEEVPSWHILTLGLPRDGGLRQTTKNDGLPHGD